VRLTNRYQQTEALFQQVQREQGGRLDVLVNNAFYFMPAMQGAPADVPPFWADKSMYQVIEVGMPVLASKSQRCACVLAPHSSPLYAGFRNHYMCTCAAAPMLLQSKGLVVNISSLGGSRFMVTTPYGVGKCAGER
jgi:dehydrogenase/reductase SDR family protein 1